MKSLKTKITSWVRCQCVKIEDWYLTKKTGRNARERAWDQWKEENIAIRADTVNGIFYKFKHIIEVDPAKIFDRNEPFGWVTVNEFHQFEYPTRELGNNTVWMWVRCLKDPWSKKWTVNEIGGEDHVFVATNNEKDAIIIALKFS